MLVSQRVPLLVGSVWCPNLCSRIRLKKPREYASSARLVLHGLQALIQSLGSLEPPRVVNPRPADVTWSVMNNTGRLA